ncbi:MAG: YkgJ family cysteine cluster protein [Thermoprotei archaeon]|nr:MAG: YkgJ family cysteine cluster protein [Thermoprotei archaeon]
MFKCIRCGKCCVKTQMVLGPTDILRITKLGYKLKEFSVISKDGLLRLKNINDHCVFYNPNTRKCNIYRWRPKGCRIYPIVYFIEDNIITVDNECTMAHTVSEEYLIQVLPEMIYLLGELGIEVDLSGLRVLLRHRR